ncbi:sensor histidine kinase [Maribacter algicola]|uniref:Sensor histidine kinase n=1 Tax=Maribacter algicola TaxID=2498892 RepID=A0A3R8R435_9FLAO|nr:tetratricopeptide repeat protein [Maribacter algicola]RRQ49564.1 sensor histidine kinase [Maribacter algicola]
MNLKSIVKNSITFFLLFLLVKVHGQNKKVDSLKNELTLHTKKDTTRVNLLNDLAFEERRANPNQAIAYLDESEMIAETKNYSKGRAKILYVRGTIDAIKTNYRDGFSNYEKAIKLYDSLGFNEGIAECYKDMGIFMSHNDNTGRALEYFEKSKKIYNKYGKEAELAELYFNIGWANAKVQNYDEAQTNYLKAIEIVEKTGNKQRLSACWGALAITYSNQGNYPAALDYYNKSLSLAERIDSRSDIISSKSNIATIYYYLKNYDKAIEIFNETLKYQKDDYNVSSAYTLNNIGLAYKEKGDSQSAYDYFNKANALFKEINNRTGVAYSLNNIGDIYLETKKYKQALIHYENGKKICLEIKNYKGLCHSNLGLAKVYEQKQNFNEALMFALESKRISVKHQLLKYEVEVEEIISDLYKNIGNYKKALESHQQFKKLNDSLFNKENIEKIAQLESEYKYKQVLDSASIRELKLNKTILSTSQDLAKTKQNYLWAIIGILLTSILSGSFVFYQKYKSVKIMNQNIVTEQKLLRSQMTPHFIFNSLSVLQGMILNKEEQKSITYLSKFSKLLRIVLENSRDKVVPLIQELDAIDNYMILQNLDADPPYDYSLIVDENIDINLFLVPPMLIQPFIENAIEHAFTPDQEHREIFVHLTFEHKELCCTIMDNGIGIDAISNKTNIKKKSLATTITKERLEMLAKDFKTPGGITIADRKDDKERGTRVTLLVPYKPNEET